MKGQNVASACDLRQNVHFQVQIFILPSYPVNNSIVIARVLFSPKTYIILFLKLGIITNNVQYTKPKITSEIKKKRVSNINIWFKHFSSPVLRKPTYVEYRKVYTCRSMRLWAHDLRIRIGWYVTVW